jgi:glycosyltransferase involved in cell wall biosynthesis
MEYAALGIPVIASDREPYRAFVLDGVTGYLVRHEHEWGKRLYELVNDEAMRVEMGAQGPRARAAVDDPARLAPVGAGVPRPSVKERR